MLILAAVAGMYVIARDNIDGIMQYALEKFLDTMGSFHSWHGHLARESGQTGYSFGEMELTLAGILSKFPAAVNVTLFRPYIFEANNLIMLISAVESGVLMLFSLYVLIKAGILGSIRQFFRQPFLLFCFSFALLFALCGGHKHLQFRGISAL